MTMRNPTDSNRGHGRLQWMHEQGMVAALFGLVGDGVGHHVNKRM
jgi:hypothetical protein